MTTTQTTHKMTTSTWTLEMLLELDTAEQRNAWVERWQENERLEWLLEEEDRMVEEWRQEREQEDEL